MSDQVYPADIRGLKWNSIKAPSFNTLIQTAPNRFETRILQSQNPIWNWTLTYDYLYTTAGTGQYNNALLSGRTYPDWQLLIGFFMARQGQFDDFLYLDPNDYVVGPALISAAPNPQAELDVVTDGTTFYSPIQRNMGGQFKEDITDLVPATLSVYANGVLQTLTTDYTVEGPGLAVPGASYGGKYLKWTAEPAGPVSVQFQFYFRVRFATDKQDFENFLQNLMTIGGHGGGQLELISCRPVIACD
jgi:hypothetical protein